MFLDEDFKFTGKNQIKILKYLEELFCKKFVILDATVTDGNYTKWLSNEEGIFEDEEDMQKCYYLNGALYKEAIILLWRGNKYWQAILPGTL